MATINAKTGHQKGTKLVTPGISNKSWAGIGSLGGLVTLLPKLNNSSNITPDITKRQIQIENSPYILQNFLLLETLSNIFCPCLVLSIRIIPRTLVASHLSKTPFSSNIIKPKYHIPITVTTIIELLISYIRNKKISGSRMPLLGLSCSLMYSGYSLPSSTRCPQ